ncbi:DUF551 domain-containing protein [Citrobacter werkmanii]|uniref:DUF551 domain-containing protein n=1 Tax=Citrobacter werkmanii TaxID=67827 RepID=UPI002953CF3B|nr:DUF551 domain-containing protein [Citrobacter werkmanii]MDV7070448.1 DUF551 domain-containing protein [Citrobacter werkmanii]
MTTNNHPAHGPVSLERLHQIREHLQHDTQYSNGGNRAYILADMLKVIDGAIAAFGVEPVAYTEKCEITNMQATGLYLRGFPDNSQGRDIALYTEPPAPERHAISTDLDEGFEKWYTAEACGAVTVAPEWFSEALKPVFLGTWRACRAAMLQGIQPVSNRDELPLGYLQGHKDGLEWAAQLAEANHPQTGDWLYDDPIDLAKAIRKGPHMPELKLVPADADDNFYSWFGRFWHENYQQNNYTTSAKQMLGTMAEFAFRAGRESATQAGNSPATPDRWIPVSERMPDKLIPVIVMYEDGEMWSAMWSGQFWDDGCTIPDPHAITHWREMPAAPQQEVNRG